MLYLKIMKQQLVRLARRVIPKNLVRHLESAYRRSRLALLDARFGWPSRHLSVIAITGTNGKTSTLGYLNSILKQAGQTTAIFTTAVIEIAGERRINDLNATVPTTAELLKFLQQAKRAKVDIVLLEITSHALDQYKIPPLQLKAAIFTNLTQDHLDYHKTMANYLAAKQQLWQFKPQLSVLNIDDIHWQDFAKLTNQQTTTYGQNQEADWQISQLKLTKKGLNFELSFADQKLEINSHLAGEFNAYNAAAAAACAYELNLANFDQIQTGIRALKSIPGRMEQVDNSFELDILVDYAHTPDALERLLKSARQTNTGQTWLVFGSCGDRDRAKRPIMGQIAADLADQIVVTDEEPYNEDPAQIRQMIIDGIKQTKSGTKKLTEIADRQTAIDFAIKKAKPGDTILITGMGHEQFRIVGGQKQPWNDHQAAKRALAKRI